jgi:hypothetical protein
MAAAALACAVPDAAERLAALVETLAPASTASAPPADTKGTA